MKILDRYDNVCLWEGEAENMREAALAAIAAKVNLSGVNLSGADLSRANLSSAYLSGADLSGAYLSGANLSGADLSSADLSGADLSGADLSGADLSSADLSGADLSSADLSSADLSGADLSGADLSGADLSFAENAELPIAQTRILPEGSLIGWKKLQGDKIAKLRIPDDAKRSHAFGRKCRAEFAEVLAIYEGSELVDSGNSKHDPEFVYKVGKIVRPKEGFSENWQEECESGIHFFITRIEAENY